MLFAFFFISFHVSHFISCFFATSPLFSYFEDFFFVSPSAGAIYFASLHVTVPDHLGKQIRIARERICLVHRGLAQFEAGAFALLIIYGERGKSSNTAIGVSTPVPVGLSFRHTLPSLKMTRSVKVVVTW